MTALRTILAFALALAAMPARAQSIMAGEWQITLTQSGIPGAPAASAMQCVSGLQAGDPGVIARRARPRADCTTTSTPAGEGEYKWTFDCPQSAMSGRGQMHYSSTEMAGEIHSSTRIGGSNIDLTQDIAAKRVGPCN
ncbi:MAG TPA: DUF3617 family protein [Burkholderiales bacterium]|nr:DUF3617 family protein [Burkholderiales bacterium]